MLTDLSFLEKERYFPPEGEEKRIKKYRDNKKLFESEHESVYQEMLKRIQRVVGNFEGVISYPVIINYQKLISLKTADLLLGEEPIIKTTEENQALLEEVLESNPDIFTKAYQVAIDTSRYGDGLFYVRDSKDTNYGELSTTQPPMWFPVVSEDDVQEIKYHVLAWTYNDGDNLKVQIHDKGSYTVRHFELEDSMIVSEITSMEEEIETGLSDFAVVQVSNVKTSDTIFGYDDYTDIDSIVSDLMVRIGQIDKILDKHADPSMTGPASALYKDPATGQWSLKTKNYFSRDSKDDPKLEYVTWQGQLESNFKQIELLINMLYTISEMGAAIFGDFTRVSTGQIPSGTALRRLMMSPLAKINRIRMNFDKSLKKAIALCAEKAGQELSISEITINWQDGLPNDIKETADILNIRTGGKATLSVKRALTNYLDFDEQSADEEIERIADEEQQLNPMNATMSFAEDNVLDNIDEE